MEELHNSIPIGVNKIILVLIKRISIEDTTNDEVLNLAGLGSGKLAARMRGVHPNPCAPVCTNEFEQQESVETHSPSNFQDELSTITVILPHNLLDKSRLKS